MGEQQSGNQYKEKNDQSAIDIGRATYYERQVYFHLDLEKAKAVESKTWRRVHSDSLR